MTKILVCNPKYYGIHYSINPWMDVKNTASNQLAVKQWANLVSILKDVGAEVLEMEGAEKLPDQVFTANAGLVKDNKVVLSYFAYNERRPERTNYQSWFQKNGYEILDWPDLPDTYFEGAGDALFGENGETLVLASGFRSSKNALPGETLSALNITCLFNVTLLDPYFYHLDTCFCPLKNNYALVWPGAFSDNDLKILSLEFKLVMVPEADAKKFACNAVNIDDNVIMPSGCDYTKKALSDVGFKVFDTDMSEFIKAGGACKCLTLKV